MKPQKLLSYPKCVVMAEVTPLRVRINGADASEQQSLIMPGVAAQPVPCVRGGAKFVTAATGKACSQAFPQS
jgi:hypothetical protein